MSGLADVTLRRHYSTHAIKTSHGTATISCVGSSLYHLGSRFVHWHENVITLQACASIGLAPVSTSMACALIHRIYTIGTPSLHVSLVLTSNHSVEFESNDASSIYEAYSYHETE